MHMHYKKYELNVSGKMRMLSWATGTEKSKVQVQRSVVMFITTLQLGDFYFKI